jgi:hypothetical protein
MGRFLAYLAVEYLETTVLKFYVTTGTRNPAARTTNPMVYLLSELLKLSSCYYWFDGFVIEISNDTSPYFPHNVNDNLL